MEYDIDNWDHFLLYNFVMRVYLKVVSLCVYYNFPETHTK